MRDHLREKVTLAYTYGSLTPEFVHSLLMLQKHDATYGKRLRDDWLLTCQTTNIASGRNKIVEAFLAAKSRPDWLLFIDTDQAFDPDLIERMVASADPVERPILSALIMGFRGNGATIAPACATIDNNSNIVVPQTIPAAQYWHVGMVGCGCVLIHRSVLEAVGAEWKPRDPYPWFTANMPWKRVDKATGAQVLDAIGEDYAFCLRAAGLGFGSVVDTTIEVGHVKKRTLMPADFWAENPQAAAIRWEEEPAATVAIIPFKDKWKMTRNVARDSADADLVLLMNNGSSQDATKAAVDYARANENVEVIDCKGLGIHEMWNSGAEVALERFGKLNLAFLNNDLELGDDCLPTLAEALRSGPPELAAVCPNYDRRMLIDAATQMPLGPISQLEGICANRYDGTGGLAGFCFMVKGEMFQAGYRFPEDCMWWFGDNDLTMTIDAAGGWYGMVHAATVKHLDGGGQTGDWSNYLDTEQGQRDLAAFKAKWNLTEAAA